MPLIYRLISPSGNSYIGLTKGDVQTRFKQHINLWKSNKRKRKTKLQYAFDKYAPEEWTIETLFESEDASLLGAKEIEYVKLFDTLHHGYNSSPGGDLGAFGQEFDEEHCRLIAEGKRLWWNSPAGQEYKRQLSEKFKTNNPSKKGRTPWNKGGHHNEEVKQKISIGSRRSWESDPTRRIFTKEHCRNISIGKANMHHKMSEEQKQAISYRNKGKKTSKKQKEAATETMSKTWRITEPAGNELIIYNLNAYCKKHNLSTGNIITHGHSKGYRAVCLSPPTVYKIISPTNEEFETTNLKQFAADHNINYGHLTRGGKAGWKVIILS